MPHKIWTVGEEVLAADFQSYLQNQTVVQFPNVAARDTWAAPPKGAHCITTDTNTRWLYSGAAWQPLPGGAGMSCRVYRTTTQPISNVTATAVFCDAERWDTDGMHAAGTQSRLTIPAGGDGLWDFGASVEFGTHSAGSRMLSLRVDGSLEVAKTMIPTVTDVNIRAALTLSTHYRLVATDYIEAVVWHNNGGTLSLAVSPNYGPEIWATRIAL